MEVSPQLTYMWFRLHNLTGGQGVGSATVIQSTQHLSLRPMGFPFLCMCIQLTRVVIQHVLLLVVIRWQHPPYTLLVRVHVRGWQRPPPRLRLLPWVTERGWSANLVPRIGVRSTICHVCSIRNQSVTDATNLHGHQKQAMESTAGAED